MGRKVFVSYKHQDSSIRPLNGYGDTVRAYVDYLIANRLNDEIYKGEGDEDLSQFKDETIRTRLKTKIHDSSITLVLISPNMKDAYKEESEQWIPWEISYSLKEITRSNKMSHTNGVLAILLPDYNNSYEYIFNNCFSCKSRLLKTDFLFKIIRDNIFNRKGIESLSTNCPYCSSYGGSSSYIETVKWDDFLSQKDHYLDRASTIRDERRSYNISKEVNNDW